MTVLYNALVSIVDGTRLGPEETGAREPRGRDAPTTVLVTGGAGFIGSHVAAALIARGHRTVILDDLSTGRRENIPEGAEFVLGDIRDAALLQRLFAEHKPRWVNHHAAQTSVVRSTVEPIMDAEINIVGTLRLLNACEHHGVERFVFASTGGAMYGEVAEGQCVSVGSSPARPLSPYGCSKLAAETYTCASRVAYRVLRYANVYGPRQNPHGEAGVISIFGKRMCHDEPCTIFARRTPGDDGCVRDYVYIGDVVRANLAAHDGRLTSDITDIGTGRGTTTRELAELLRTRLSSRAPLLDAPPRPGDTERSVLDPAAARAAIGQLTSLELGLDHTVAWLRNSDS